jgi:ABC-type lipoprotein export system ATPase subunit
MSDGDRAPEAIRAVDLVKTFDGGLIRALDGVDLSVARSEWVAVTGPSGCGKSTLLHLIAGLDRPTSGKIFVNGRDLARIRDLDEFRRREVGLVFQLHNLLTHLTALQNVEVAMFSNGLNHGQQRERSRALLEAVGLSARGRTEPTRLSGGERQRLAIARALANEPAVLLADEPTGNLDSASVKRLLDLLREIRESRGVTILLVTHDPNVASAADRVIRMRDGRVIDEGA